MKPFYYVQTNELYLVFKIMLPTNYLSTNHVCVYVCKQDLALNNTQVLICHKTQTKNHFTAVTELILLNSC